MSSRTQHLTVAQLIAQYLVAQGVTRIYGLCGGHIQPMWDAVVRAGVEVVDVRHEASAVYMAQAENELTGKLGVAMVTAGPGLTNAVTAIANASVSRSSVLILSGRTPRPQTGMGAMQDVPQAEIVAPLCRRVERVAEAHHVLPRLDAVVSAALGNGRQTGPAYIDFPTEMLDEQVRPADILEGHLARRQAYRVPPYAADVSAAADLIADSRRLLVISGRSLRSAVPQLKAFLDLTGALYLDSSESRGLMPGTHPAYVPATRSQVMSEADLVITLGRRLDFQLAYGSPAVFAPNARFLRIGKWFEETAENRRGTVEVYADTDLALAELIAINAMPADTDHEWVNAKKETNRKRLAKLEKTIEGQSPSDDGRMHPYQLIGAINRHLDERSVVIADGGDILSFARVALKPVRYLDCGALGCLGVGVPFGIAAALNNDGGPVISLIGDGSFGFTAIEVDTAVRRSAKVLFVVANNEAWNIERRDQMDRYNGNLVGVDLSGCRYDVVARGLGAYAERVERIEDLDAAIKRGLENAPALLDVSVTRDAVSSDYRNGLAAVPPRHALRAWNDAEIERYG
jgi:acetolactate synthase-1/2/3 large subunit